MKIGYKEIILSSDYTEEDDVMSFIEDGLKYSCDGLRLLKATSNSSNKVIIRKEVLVICDEAFSNSMASEVVLPDGLALIGESAFESSAIETVTIPAKVLEIGAWAFSKCNKLKRVSFNNMKILNAGKMSFESCHNLDLNCKNEIEGKFGSRVFKEEKSHRSSYSCSGDYQNSHDSGADSSDYVFGLLKDNEPWFYVP